LSVPDNSDLGATKKHQQKETSAAVTSPDTKLGSCWHTYSPISSLGR